MIGYIKGQVTETGNGCITIDNGGIGYEAFVSSSTISQIGSSTYVQLYTYLNVREDGIFLYGFYTKEEKNMFLKLITVSGVGPKAALSILSGIALNKLMVAIINKDIKTLSQVKGIGKKTAERIILELKENIDAAMDDALDNLVVEQTDDVLDSDADTQDAIYALRGLGFTQSEAVKAVRSVRNKARDLQELIALALKSLN